MNALEAAAALPDWVRWIAALGPTTGSVATVAVAVVVAIISYRQWLTAHDQKRIANDRLVLELFEQRMKIYSDARSAVRLVMRDGKVADNNSHRDLIAAWRASRFLFGDDVVSFLEIWVDLLGKCYVADRNLENLDLEESERKLNIDKRYDVLRRLDSFFQEIDRLCAPYMRMIQKMDATGQ